MTCVTGPDICRMRGDTFPFVFIVKDSSGTAINITGYTYLLTVDPSDEPTGSGNNLFQLTGTVIDGPAGKVQFSLSSLQANQTPGDYYYDVQQTSSGVIRTIAKGKWTFRQDITK